MQFSTTIELIKILSPSIVVALIGWLLLRRLEEIKAEVTRRSDFNQKWADLLFDATNALMVAGERIMTYAFLVISDHDQKSSRRAEWTEEMNNALEIFLENRYRISRLSLLAESKGAECEAAATGLSDRVLEVYSIKSVKLDELRDKIMVFNRAAREAHSEMIGLRRSTTAYAARN